MYTKEAWACVSGANTSDDTDSNVQHVLCNMERSNSSAIKLDRVEITFILALFFQLKPLPDDRGDETQAS